ncbi:MAG TPA: hypothetical protein VKG25_00640 [Bryobacteraceae bacterium]|nr:hypothetical protein [Bryobacteraceae bacterium]
MRTLFTLTCLTLAGNGFSQTQPDLSGKWQSKSDGNLRWVLAQTPDQIHVQEYSGSSLKADYVCNELGKECEIKDSGHSEKTSFWFNGPKLVELRVHGGNVVKRRYDLLDDGKTLEVELLPISPPGKTEKLEFARAQ